MGSLLRVSDFPDVCLRFDWLLAMLPGVWRSALGKSGPMPA